MVAETDEIIGFGSMEAGGYLDTLYVHPHYQRQGIAQQLLNRLEAWALARGAAGLTVEASMVAQPFFRKNGYGVIRKQKHQLLDELLINFVMQKSTL